MTNTIHNLYLGCGHLIPAPQDTALSCNNCSLLQSAMGFSIEKDAE